ncbi:MAG TPA: hypothetical protein VG755_29720 [Nannocystaceae bacterium]|nr:hypothetical protein [Nannocystaceae bacterium]
MRRNGLQGIVAIALVAGCGNAGTAEGDGETSSGHATSLDATSLDATSDDPSTSGAHDDTCVPGWEGCPCFEDARCIEGLMCLSNHCVLVPDAGSSEGDATDATTTESSGDPTDASSSEESSSTGLPDVCYDDDTYCDDDELQTCVDGQWVVVDCEDACALTGYSSAGCEQAEACSCDVHSDEVCDNAAYQHCICIDALYGVVSCTSAQLELEYQACFADTTPANTCWSQYDVQTIEDCEMAVAECGA